MQAILDDGYPESLALDHVKIGLGLATIGCALGAHFFPKGHPLVWEAVAGLVGLYLLGTAVLWAVALLWEKNYILVTHPKKSSFGLPGLKLTTNLERFSDRFTLRLETASPASPYAQPPAESEHSITKYFDAEGRCAVEAFEADVRRLLRTFERGGKKE